MADKILKCIQCGGEFIFTASTSNPFSSSANSQNQSAANPAERSARQREAMANEISVEIPETLELGEPGKVGLWSMAMITTKRDPPTGEITVMAKDFTVHVTETGLRILIDDAVVHEWSPNEKRDENAPSPRERKTTRGSR